MYKIFIWTTMGAFSGSYLHISIMNIFHKKYFNHKLLSKENLNIGFVIGGAIGFMRALVDQPIIPYVSNKILSRK